MKLIISATVRCQIRQMQFVMRAQGRRPGFGAALLDLGAATAELDAARAGTVPRLGRVNGPEETPDCDAMIDDVRVELDVRPVEGGDFMGPATGGTTAVVLRDQLSPKSALIVLFSDGAMVLCPRCAQIAYTRKWVGMASPAPEGSAT